MNPKAGRPLLRSKTRLILVLLVIFAFTDLLSAESNWRKYENARFGFVLTYPASLLASLIGFRKGDFDRLD